MIRCCTNTASFFHYRLKWPQVLSINGTVFLRVWLEILILVVYTSVVIGLYEYYDLYETDYIGKDFNVIQVLGIVTGMLLVFRTNTAYDRYYEGRKLWSEVVNCIRVITRTIWVLVDDKKDPKLLVGKISVLNLLVAFAYATKHYLREEYSNEEEDLKAFIGHLPQLLTPSSNETLEFQEKLSMVPTKKKIKHIRIRAKRSENRNLHKRMFGSEPYATADAQLTSSNIPLEISFFISSYFVSCRENNLIDSPTCRILDTAVANMVRCLTGMERIRRTPIPWAYSVHLQQITWIVLLMLPFQWGQQLRWYTIPAAFLAAFSLFGILGIGREIENPFGYDYNDLNLDDFCKTIHKEVLAIISQPMPKSNNWLYSDKNLPITSDLSISAETLSKMNYEEIEMILSQGKDYKFFHQNHSKSNVSHKSASVKTDNISQSGQKV